MIRKSMPAGHDPMGGYRFSLATNAKRLRGDHAQKKIEWDEIRLGPFFCPGRSAARVLRAGVHSTLHGVVFAIFCPGPALHRRRDAMPGPGHEVVSASRLRDESIQLQHIML